MKKNIEKSDMPISRPTMSAPRSVRRRKIENGISGWRWRRSIATNAASSTAEPASRSRGPVEPPPDVDGAAHRVHEQRKPGRDRHRAGDVKALGAILASALEQQPRRHC